MAVKELSLSKGAVNLIGVGSLQKRLAGINARLTNPEVPLAGVMEMLQLQEVSLFERLSPHFVQTGRVRDSLVGLTGDSIREIHGATASFGTRVWYAKFLRKQGGPSGKPRGRKREGPNLVLRLTNADKAAALKAYARYLLDA